MESINAETFIRTVREAFSRYSSKLSLQPPEFDVKDPIMIAAMKCQAGDVRIIVAPPEFHPEIVIRRIDGAKYNLGDIYSFEPAADWMQKKT